MAKRVFFSFHYDDVKSFRANVVRNHRVVKGNSSGYFDASLWENAKRTGPESIKRLINDGLNNTSVTAVLIGSETYDRRWVRYEIIKSMYRGNDIVGIHINSVKDRFGYTKSNGPNPFEYLGFRYSNDGKSMELYEYTNGQWKSYRDFGTYTLKTPVGISDRGQFYQLSKYYSVYDWTRNNGYDNFDRWIGV